MEADQVTEPKEPGWYVARKKTWAIGTGFAPVKVTQTDSNTFQVWQCGDAQAWPVDAWEWRARIWP